MIKKDRDKSTPLSNPRKYAGKLLDRIPQSHLPKDVQKSIHELNIHRMELEMQNEELSRAQIEIEESRNRESESKFRMLSEQSLLGIAILQDDVFKYANQTISDIVEYSVEEMLCWKAGEFSKLIYPEDKDFAMEQTRKRQKGEKGYIVNYQSRIVSKTGKIKWIEVYSKTAQFKGKVADFVTFIDINERKRVEESLAVSYRFLEIANRHMEIPPCLKKW